MKLFRKQEGFTLVELMVVVLIIGILVAIAIPVFNAAKSNAQKKSCFGNQRTIEGAANSYEAEAGAVPADIPALVTASYLKSLPSCPAAATKAAGVYSLVAGTTTVNDCGQGTPAHGYYGD